MHLIRTVRDSERTRHGEQTGELGVRHPFAPVDLNRRICDRLQHVRSDDLDRGNVDQRAKGAERVFVTKGCWRRRIP